MNLMSDQIDQLATALAKAQAEMQVAGKNCKNPFFKSMYADFESLVAASRPALSKYGLCVIQSIASLPEESDHLTTILMHSSGQWVKSSAKLMPPKQDVQSLASYTTSLKRLTYAALVGVVTGEGEDDGEMAVAPTRNEHAPVCVLTNEELSWLISLNQDIKDSIKRDYNVTDPRRITRYQFTNIQDLVKRKQS